MQICTCYDIENNNPTPNTRNHERLVFSTAAGNDKLVDGLSRSSIQLIQSRQQYSLFTAFTYLNIFLHNDG